MSHASLDGMHTHVPSNLAIRIRSRSMRTFADIRSPPPPRRFQHFTLPEAVRSQIRKRAEIFPAFALSNLAFPVRAGDRNYGALGTVSNKGLIPTLEARRAEAISPSSRTSRTGSILVAAVFDAFVTIYRSRVGGL